MIGIEIRKAGINDTELLQRISIQTFVESFAKDNTAANMQQYVDANLNEEKISTELSNPHSQFYLAYDDDMPVGYLKLNTGPAQTEPQGDAALEIERIYVLPTHQGKKIGQLLYEKALSVARQQQKTSIWLGVWQHNTGAQRFYEKNGFVAFGQHIFKMGDDEQTDILVRKSLESPRD